MIDFTYLKQPPKKYTFEQQKLKAWTEKWCKGKVLNLFAGKVRLNVDEFRVDINPDMNPDACIDALDFAKSYELLELHKYMPINTVVLDPPYNWRKAKEKYGDKMIGDFPRLKDDLVRILEPGARVITFGYDSVGMANKRGFVKIAICLVCHGGDHHDTICTVEEMKTKTIPLL